MSPRLRAALIVLLCCAAAPAARAHAPLARSLALAPDGPGVAVRLPGFGLLIRAADAQPFAYVCDAMLGLSPLETAAPIAYCGDGLLLVATPQGLRLLGPNGCPAPATTDLPAVPVVAIAVHARDRMLVYAVTSGSDPALYRSRDGGGHFELRSRIALDATVSAILLDPDQPELVYMSLSGTSGPLLARSDDGGASFVASAQSRELVLLHVEPGPSGRLWARARTDAVRGSDILRAPSAAGPWQQLLFVNFFGGFAVDADTGAIWVGDEGGSVYRSSDGGDSFTDVQPKTAVACLAHARGALWACMPGTSEQRALASWPDSAADFEAIMAFADVDQQVDCAPAVDTAQVCRAAWNEWRVDVLGQGTTFTPDPPAAQPEPDSGSASEPEFESEPESAASPPRASGCAVSSQPGRCPTPLIFATLLLCACALRRRAQRSEHSRTRSLASRLPASSTATTSSS